MNSNENIFAVFKLKVGFLRAAFLFICFGKFIFEVSQHSFTHGSQLLVIGLISVDMKHRNCPMHQHLLILASASEHFGWKVFDYFVQGHGLNRFKLIWKSDYLLDETLCGLRKSMQDFKLKPDAAGIELHQGSAQRETGTHGVLTVDVNEFLCYLLGVLWLDQLCLVLKNDVLDKGNSR